MKQSKSDYTYFLAKAPVPEAIRYMSVPMMLSLTASTIQSLINSYFIGMLDNTEMVAAITVSFPFIAVFIALSGLISTGASTYISRLLGDHKEAAVRRVSSVNFWFAVLLGFGLTLLCFPFITQISALTGATGETLAYAEQYIFYSLFGMPFFIIRFSLIQAIRAEGASEAAMLVMTGSFVLNILFDALLIPVLKLGLAGAALSSGIADLAAAVFLIRFIQKKSRVQSLALKDCKPDKQMLSTILKVGLSACVLDLFGVLSATLFNRYAMRYGSHVLAAFGIANRVVNTIELLGRGISIGVVPLIAYAWAANNPARYRQIIRNSLRYILTITVLLGTLLFVFRKGALSLFSEDPDVLTVGSTIIAAQLTSTVFAMLTGFFSGVFQAIGDGVKANTMSVTRGLLLIPILLIANGLFGLPGVIWSLTVSEILCCGIGWMLYRTIGNLSSAAPVSLRQQGVPGPGRAPAPSRN